MRCEVADEPVVVMKFLPMKPGNGVEDKTGTSSDVIQDDRYWPKAVLGCEGGKSD